MQGPVWLRHHQPAPADGQVSRARSGFPWRAAGRLAHALLPVVLAAMLLVMLEVGNR